MNASVNAMVAAFKAMNAVERSEFESAFFSGQFGPAVVSRFMNVQASASDVESFKGWMAAQSVDAEDVRRAQMRAEMKAAAKKGRKSAKVGETVTIRDMVARQDFTGVVVHVTRSKNVTVQLADGTKKTGVVK